MASFCIGAAGEIFVEDGAAGRGGGGVVNVGKNAIIEQLLRDGRQSVTDAVNMLQGMASSFGERGVQLFFDGSSEAAQH